MTELGTVRAQVARHVAWNWAGVAVSALSGFIVAPFLIGRLGHTSYGLWIVITSLAEYFRFLDLGLRMSIGRHVALHRARQDHAALSATVTCGLAVLVAMAGVALIATLALVPFVEYLLGTDGAHVEGARTALFLVGTSLAVSLLLNAFDAILWGFEKFAVLNCIDAANDLLRVGLIVWLIGGGHGLTALAAITLVTTLGAGAAKATVTLRLRPRLEITPGRWEWERARALLTYGVWSLIGTIAQGARQVTGPTIIGASLGLGPVTPFSIAARLIGYAYLALTAATGVTTPLATALHATDEGANQRRLLVLAGRAAGGFAVFAVALFVFLGAPFIAMWIGPSLADAHAVLVALALGELLPMWQLGTVSALVAAARHRGLALATLAEAAIAAGLASLLVGRLGILGVGIALGVAALGCRGVFTLVYGCRVMGVSLAAYGRDVGLPVLLWTAPIVAALGALRLAYSPGTWLELLVVGGAAAGVMALAAWRLVGGHGTTTVDARRSWRS